MADVINGPMLAAYPGVTLAEEETNALVIELANGLVSDIIGDLDPIPTRVKAITLEVAARALRNPEGYTSISKQIDDWKSTVRREGVGDEVGVGVYLTDEERAYLYSLVGRGQRGIGSIRLRVPGYANCD